MKIKIGTKIQHCIFGGQVLTGAVEEIEICKPDEKYGRMVNSVDTAKHRNGVVCLDNGHWCYFDQIRRVL